MSYRRAIALSLLAACSGQLFLAQTSPTIPLKVASPDGQIVFLLWDASVPPNARLPETAGLRYAVDFHGKWLIDDSRLGLELAGQPVLGPEMRLTGSQTGSADTSYTIPVGKTNTVRDHYSSLS